MHQNCPGDDPSGPGDDGGGGGAGGAGGEGGEEAGVEEGAEEAAAAHRSVSTGQLLSKTKMGIDLGLRTKTDKGLRVKIRTIN